MTSTTWPTALSRVLALGVTSVLATAGSWTVSLLTGLPCGLSGADCSGTQAVLVAGWVVQAVLLLVAVVLFLPPVERRLRGARMVATALAVPATAILVLVTTFLVADQADDTFSRPHDRGRYDRDQHDRGQHDRGQHDRGQHDRGQHDRGQHDRGQHDRGQHDRGRAPTTRDLVPSGGTRSRPDASQTQIGEDHAASPSTWTTRA
ncbi:hypothetical protein [Nocardioides sp. AX2bis]|uniref:hypothetical protein n=1 Tax=Nocardioides sp. AX2bis TaxID=2653157 RepID=UPI0012F079F1|nr:hypothetical protein [Nocardioides sp. AX2bis]VXB90828.1 membrane hypothetical protein [Nocardioides sp. AX2bis]